MAASSLLALIDDIASILDDVAVLTKTAAMKTSGVMGDDLALNAEQVSGVHVDRELPVVWAVGKGSFINKLILVPAALLISAFFPPAIMPLMMVGGVFLCYEGFEKVAHKLLHSHAEAAAHHAEHLKALVDPAVDVVALEKGKIKGAIRTDFVLSAEIIVITIGTMSTEPMLQQVIALSVVAIAATVLVYGLVAGIVKLDDLGLALQKRGDATARRIGAGILRAAPIMMKGLSILGTAAMFTVGGSIIAHGVPFIEHFIEGLHLTGLTGFLATTLLDALVGVVAGGMVVGVVSLFKRLRGKPQVVALLVFTLGCASGASTDTPVPNDETRPAPWSAPALTRNNVPPVLLTEWSRAGNRAQCAAIGFAQLPAGSTATPRAATFSGGWAIAYDQPDLRSAFGVAGTSVNAADPAYDEWPYRLRWADGSTAGYGPEGGTGPNQLAYLRIAGQTCLYNVWSRLGREHLEQLLGAIRFVDPT